MSEKNGVCIMNDMLTSIDATSFEDVVSVGPLTFPSRIVSHSTATGHEENFGIVMGHGLAEKNQDSDDWTPLAIPGALSSNLSFRSMVFYTARGHGDTNGWQDSTDADPDQFMWPRLSEDMIGVAKSMGYDKYIVGGESMGSSTAFFAALQNPDQVKAVIMMRPPTAWDTRAFQREHLESKAKKLEESPSSRYPPQFYKVLRATAKSDYPPIEGPGSEIYGSLERPVLLLAVRNDPIHPVSTSTILHKLLPNSELHVVEDHAEAVAKWPEIIKNFLDRINLNNS